MKFGLFIGFSVLVHVVLFASIFDIYFTSPLVQGVTSFRIGDRVQPAARRLVLFVADGLRAETFFDKATAPRTPYLRDVMKFYGTWGISHTHIPTESRPGHVALIAGFYEDVSAVMKGWKENPVEFDSVFNQSRETWSWGSPDILPMFAKGSSGDHVHIHCYPGKTESFAGDDSSKLDTWVFDRFQEFLETAKTNETLLERVHRDEIIFFFHLLGIDSNGHSHTPKSKEYINNIEIVDKGVSNTVQLLDGFYENDGKTSYLFTADHGMTDWGSHGAGHSSETLTPLVAWGAGIKSPSDPQQDKGMSDEDRELSRSWGLDHRNRYDVDQADVSALMSALLGIPYPVNSVGALPVDYLSCAMERKSQLMRLNAKQIAEQFSVKMKNVKEHATRAFFRPYSKLTISDVARRDRDISDLISKEDFSEAIAKSKELIELSLDGLRYYHTYDRAFLYFPVMLSFVGWIIVTMLLGIKQVKVIESQAIKLKPLSTRKVFCFDTVKFVFALTLLAETVLLLAVRSPWTYYVYCLLPTPVWYWIAEERFVIKAVIKVLLTNQELAKRLSLYGFFGLCGIWILIGSFFYRNFLSIGLLALSLLPKLCGDTTIISLTDKLWMTLCAVIAVFPALPTVGRNPNMGLVMLGGFLAATLCVIISFRANLTKDKTAVKFSFPVISAFIVYLTSDQSTTHGTVSFFIHVLSWSILALSWVAPLLSGTKIQERLLNIYLWQMSAYMLLSLSYDALFCVVLCGLMHTWMHAEHDSISAEEKGKLGSLNALDFQELHISLGDSDTKRQPSLSDVRRSFMLVYFLVTAFFGVGNIASMNSFDVRVVLPFVTVFDPFVMGGLLAYKVLMPYLMVTCSFCGIALSTRMPLRTLCCIVMVISDVMAMHFVFMIKDSGSWLDIGTSISHFVIVMSMIVSLLLFFVAANFLTTFSTKSIR